MFGLPKSISLLLVAAPALVSAGIFSPSSGVEMLDHAGFKKVMKEQVLIHLNFRIQWLMILPENCSGRIRRTLVWCMFSYVSLQMRVFT